MTAMQRVQSSNVEAVGYEPETQVLTVQFKSSPRAYKFKGVPEEVYSGLLNADSVGRYFNDHIKDTYDAA